MSKSKASNYYKIYQNDCLNCAVCGSLSNLYYMITHLRKSKTCLKIQNELKELDENSFKQKLLDFKMKIKQLKSNIRAEIVDVEGETTE